MYEKVSPELNFKEREKNVEKFWRDNHIFEKSVTMRENGENYTFYDGPPTANGKPHIGHVLTRVIKDMIPRYRTMKGYHVIRKAGWDTHGLPVELEVEKKLGLDGKEQIEQYGLEDFIKECKESVWKYKGMWEDFSGTVGFWADMDNPYVTYHNDFIESEWWALKQIWEKKLLYKGHKIVPYCPRCGTPLSSHEVAQGYKDVKERSAIVRFKLSDEDAYILAWTTTPWTLPSNVALCVNANENYAKVKAADGYTYYMAEALLDAVLGRLKTEDAPAYEVLSVCKGKELEYRGYEPLYDFVRPICEKQHKKSHIILCDDYVTLTDGTGVVHQAPAFGEDDARVGRKYDIAFVQLVNEKGEMTKETPWAGLFVKKADKPILEDLERRGLLYDAPKFEHSYPHCWRCDTPLIYYARESWFIKMTAVRDDLIRNNETIHWIPKSIGEGRFGDWLKNVQDWGVSRNRYWGTPLNIWECSCGHMHSIGSIAELKELSDNCPEDIELHRPFIDQVTIRCDECGGEMKRVPEVIDCWFDSGSMPFAQWHYPFENEEMFKANFPANFISEAVDQTRGWFYSLLAISTLLFNKAPYKNVIVLGHVQDENGQKMSKSKGNAVDPFDALDKHGADAIRWYFYSNSAPHLPNRFHDAAVTEGQRKFMGTLWNTYAFYVLYAEIDAFDPTAHVLDRNTLTILDKWLLSKLNTLVKTVDTQLSEYKITEPAKALSDFVDQLSNWYVRRSRERFWGKDMTQDKINAYMTLYTALVTLIKLAAPMIPFVTEDIYQNLVRSVDKTAPESVHLCDYPVCDESFIDTTLEKDMEQVLDIVVLGRSARNAANIKIKQPLSRMIIKAEGRLPSFCTDIITEELNVKVLEFTSELGNLVSYSVKPKFDSLKAKYAADMGQIIGAVTKADASAIVTAMEGSGSYHLTLPDGRDIALMPEDVIVETKKTEGFEAASGYGITVAMDTNLTPQLIEEGWVREIVSNIQKMRKAAGFEVMDHITVYIVGSDRVLDVVKQHEADIATVVLAESIVYGEHTKIEALYKLSGETVTLGVKKN